MRALPICADRCIAGVRFCRVFQPVNNPLAPSEIPFLTNQNKPGRNARSVTQSTTAGGTVANPRLAELDRVRTILRF